MRADMRLIQQKQRLLLSQRTGLVPVQKPPSAGGAGWQEAFSVLQCPAVMKCARAGCLFSLRGSGFHSPSAGFLRPAPPRAPRAPPRRALPPSLPACAGCVPSFTPRPLGEEFGCFLRVRAGAVRRGAFSSQQTLPGHRERLCPAGASISCLLPRGRWWWGEALRRCRV